MRIVPILLASVLICSVLAGCASNDPSAKVGGTSTSKTSASATISDTKSTTTSGSASSTSSPSASTSTTSAPASQPPVINSFKAEVAAMTAIYTFNATDTNKDSLTFILSFGDASTDTVGSLPKANATHTFAAAGNYTAKLTVSDGKLSVNKTYLVQITVATATGQTEALEWTTGWVSGCGLFLNASDPNYGPLDGIIWDVAAIKPESIGKPFTAIFGAGDGDHVAGEYLWFSGAAAAIETFSAAPGGTVTGIVPADAVVVAVASCAPTGNTASFVVG